jgi:S-adenosylmethionine/arginine decarboxylase-like enzyme
MPRCSSDHNDGTTVRDLDGAVHVPVRGTSCGEAGEVGDSEIPPSSHAAASSRTAPREPAFVLHGLLAAPRLAHSLNSSNAHHQRHHLEMLRKCARYPKQRPMSGLATSARLPMYHEHVAAAFCAGSRRLDGQLRQQSQSAARRCGANGSGYAPQLQEAEWLSITQRVGSKHVEVHAEDLTQTQGQHCYLDMYLEPNNTPSIVWLHQTVQDHIEAAGPTIVHRHLSETETGFHVDFLLDESHTSVSMHADGSFSMDCFTCGDSNPQNILNSVMKDVVEHFPLASAEGAKYNWVRRFYESATTTTIGLDEPRHTTTRAMHAFFDITNFKPADGATNGAWLRDVMAACLAEGMNKNIEEVHAKNVHLPLPGANSPPGFTNLVACGGARVTAHAYEDTGIVAMDVYGPCDAKMVSEKICDRIISEKAGHVSRMDVVSRLDASN